MSYHPFSAVEQAPPDPILGLTEAFKADPNPKKINLTSGVFMDESGTNTVLKSVKQAERMWLEQETTKNYLGIGGDASYGEVVQTFIFGKDHPLLKEGRATTIHAPGGTGALRVGADFYHGLLPGAKVWVSDPTWPNHHGVFRSAGMEVASYPYYNASSQSLRFEEMLASLEQVPENDVVLLHACCHNPTGIDPTKEQWLRIVEVFKKRAIVPFLDFAYQGFASGLEDDSLAVRTFSDAGMDMLVSSSFSKNFGLYRERVGALTLVSSDRGAAGRVLSSLKQKIRSNYSNPPAHGGKVVELVIGTPELKAMWEQEVDGMRDRIRNMRRLFVETLKKYGVSRNFDFLMEQNGMFSFSGIEKEAVIRLKEEFGIYIVENGRINVAAMTTSNMDYLCQSIAKVLNG